MIYFTVTMWEFCKQAKTLRNQKSSQHDSGMK
jgi:hypothetical protein